MTEVALIRSILAVAMAGLAVARAGSGRPAAITELRLARLEATSSQQDGPKQ